MLRRLVFRASAIAALAAVIATAGCGAVDEPRRAERTEGDVSATQFESPRQTFIVEASPEIGNVAFRGVVRSRDREVIAVPADGRVLEVFFATNDAVATGDDILVFLPAPSEAELIGLDIARLEIDRLIADEASASEVAVAKSTLDDLEAAYAARTQTFQAERSGAIGPTRQNVAYRVTAGDDLYELSDPNDLIVEVVVAVDDLDSVASGTAVSLVASAAATSTPLTGTIFLAAVQDEPAIVELDDPAGVALGDRLSVSLPVQSVDGAQWVPLDAVGRQDGSSFVLVVDDNDRLRRVAVNLGRRTQTHVQVLSGVDIGMELARP